MSTDSSLTPAQAASLIRREMAKELIELVETLARRGATAASAVQVMREYLDREP